jgi:hypothetical protein
MLVVPRSFSKRFIFKISIWSIHSKYFIIPLIHSTQEFLRADSEYSEILSAQTQSKENHIHKMHMMTIEKHNLKKLSRTTFSALAISYLSSLLNNRMMITLDDDESTVIPCSLIFFSFSYSLSSDENRRTKLYIYMNVFGIGTHI